MTATAAYKKAVKHADIVATIGGILTDIVRQPDGSLVFTYTPTTGAPVTFNAGAVPAGRSVQTAEVNAGGQLVLTFDDGTTVNCGTVKGADGEQGPQGTPGRDGASDATDVTYTTKETVNPLTSTNVEAALDEATERLNALLASLNTLINMAVSHYQWYATITIGADTYKDVYVGEDANGDPVAILRSLSSMKNGEDYSQDQSLVLKKHIAAIIAAVNTAAFAGPYADVSGIPTPYDTNDLYLVGAAAPYAIYALIEGVLENIGNTAADLSNYYTKEETDAEVAAHNTDPGAHAGIRAEIAKVRTVTWKGVFVELEGTTQIIEASDLDPQFAPDRLPWVAGQTIICDAFGSLYLSTPKSARKSKTESRHRDELINGRKGYNYRTQRKPPT